MPARSTVRGPWAETGELVTGEVGESTAAADAGVDESVAAAGVESQTPASFIEIAGLEKVYEGEAAMPVHALKGIDLRVDEGAFIGVMGQSGSGKSTLLSILGGLSHPTRGRVLVDGIDLYGLPGERLADFRREYIGFVFQAFNLIPYLNAVENVMLPLSVKRPRRARRRTRASRRQRP
jgi:putative ABC transport system ATP-binding protein